MIFTDKIIRILEDYQVVKTRKYSKSDFTDLVNVELPMEIRNILTLDDNYKIYGSCGTGGWAETPWVAILKKDITTSTTEGYYIVLLFDTKKREMFLTLAIGWTQFEEQFGNKIAKEKIEEYGNYFYTKLKNVPPGFIKGNIDLSAVGPLTAGYEHGQIISKKYEINELLYDQIVKDMQALVKTYSELEMLAGNNILNISYDSIVKNEDLSNLDIRINQTTLLSDPEIALEEVEKIISNVPPGRREATIQKILRNRKISLFVKQRAKYICQVCGRKPFIQKNGKPYAEADHIEPLGGSTKGLDTPDNMRCLCSQCHAVITHGADDEVRKILSQ